MTRPVAWRDTARMPRLFGLDARVLLILVLPVIAPAAKLPLLAVCGLAGLGFTVAEWWFGLTPDNALRRLRACLAGRRHAVLPDYRAVRILCLGDPE